jgi:oligoribonuclease
VIVWVDTETTGLSPASAELLEVAAIITDDDFHEVARFHRVLETVTAWNIVNNDRRPVPVAPNVIAMHHANGLWVESAQSKAHPYQVDNDLLAFIETHTKKDGETKPTLGGSTVAFDREFMRRYLWQSLQTLHYRNLDVTSLNEMARRCAPNLHKNRPHNGSSVQHRAMPDIEASINVARYYARVLGGLT